MSVYVDQAMPCIPNVNWKYKFACHMFADTEEELHEMAATVGLDRKYFQSDNRLPHYDLVPTKRVRAVKAGAVEVSKRFVADTIAKNRRRTRKR